MILALWLACAPADPLAPEVEVRTWVAEKTGSGGVVVLQTRTPEGRELVFPVPEVDGLTFTEDGEPRAERLGDEEVVTQRWRFTGKKGSYELPALTVEVDGEVAASAPLWIDLGVEAPNAGQLTDIVEPGELWAVPWRWLTAGVFALLVLLVGVLATFVRLLRRPTPPPPVVAPDVRALSDWARVKADPALNNEERASAISNILRAYVEEVLDFPATAWTTTEIVERLVSMAHLPKGNVQRAKRLLQATDLIKYADAQSDDDLIDDLDADLRGFVGSTRPRNWQADAPAAQEVAHG